MNRELQNGEKAYDPKTLEQMQKVRLRQARRHREALRTMQGKAAAILERPQEGRRRCCGSTLGGVCWREDEEEIKDHFADVGKMVSMAVMIFGGCILYSCSIFSSATHSIGLTSNISSKSSLLKIFNSQSLSRTFFTAANLHLGVAFM